MSERDDLIALVLLAFGGFVIWEAWRMPRFEQLAVNPYTVPGLVPGFLGAAIVLFALVMLTRTMGRRRLEERAAESDRAEPAGDAPAGDDAPVELEVVGEEPAEGAAAPARGRGGESLRRLLITLGLTLGYALGLIGWLPFWLATFVFVFVFITAFDWRKAAARRRIVSLVLAAGLQALLVAAAVTLVFERLFLVRLP